MTVGHSRARRAIRVVRGYLINSFALLLAPAFAAALFPGILLPAFIGELSFCLWMIVKGINLAPWQQQVHPTPSM